MECDQWMPMMSDPLKRIKKKTTDNGTVAATYNFIPISCSQHSPGGREAAVFAGHLPTVHILNMLFQVFLLQFIK